MKKLSLVLAVCLPLSVLSTFSVSSVEDTQMIGGTKMIESIALNEGTRIEIDAPIINQQQSKVELIKPINDIDKQQKDTQLFIDILSEMQTLQANFNQLSVSNNRISSTQTSGVFKVKKPGKYAWVVESPYAEYTLSNGEKVWKYDVDLEEVNIEKVNDKNNQMMQLLQSTQTQTLLNDYKIHADRYGDESVFSFVPHNDEFGIAQITISFVDNKLNNIRIQSDLEQATILEFSDMVINQPIKDSEFELAIPEGVDVYDNTLFDDNF
ncbi:MAG: outer-membrane lipoprotein carrier protein LolA [Saccharospirillaceae bacterium]|nr:outer-membrane lipoprotein carrier protein LolA [Pseudomonadales bacterium]NRB81830.1 outer-membrane lipoprotein carrier protein LolA [Saccharospirillaceae bacterium]